MNLFVKAYQIGEGGSVRGPLGYTGPVSGLAALPVTKVGAVESSLEEEACHFKVGSVEVECVGLPENFFAAHAPTDPFIIEVQYGPAWDDAASDVIFYGVLDPESVSYDGATRRTALEAVSWDGMLADHPEIQPRPVYRTRVTSSDLTRRIAYLTPEQHGRIDGEQQESSISTLSLGLHDFGGLADILVRGATIVAHRTGERESVEYRLVAGDTWPVGDSVQVSPIMGSAPELMTDLSDQWEFRKAYRGEEARDVARKIVVYGAERFVPSSLVGKHIIFPPNSAGRRRVATIVAAHSSVGQRGAPTQDGRRFPVEITLDEIKSDAGTSGMLSLLDRVEPTVGSDAEIWGRAIYGYEQQGEGDYDMRRVVHALLANTDTLGALIEPHDQMTVLGQPVPLSRLVMPSTQVSEALSQLQKAGEFFLAFGAGERIGGTGARQVSVRLITRAHLASAPASALPVPIKFNGQALGSRPLGIVFTTGAPAFNEPQIRRPMRGGTFAYNERATGFYPPMAAFAPVEERDRKRLIQIESPLSVPIGAGLYQQFGTTLITNDDALRGLAARYWQYYASFYKEKSVVLPGLFPATGGGLPTLGALVTVETGEGLASGIVRSLKLDYDKQQTTLRLAIGDGVVAPALFDPVARLSLPVVVAGAGSPLQARLRADASASRSPHGAPLSFRWFVSGAEVIGETAATADLIVQDGSVVKVRVTDDGGRHAEAEATVEVVERPEAADPLAAPLFQITRYNTPAERSADPNFTPGHFDASKPVSRYDHMRVKAIKPGTYLRVSWQVTDDGAVVASGHYEGYNAVDDVVAVERPDVRPGRAEPVRLVRIEAEDTDHGLFSPPEFVLVEKNPAAQILSAQASLKTPETLFVSFSGDSDTKAVRVVVERVAASSASHVATQDFASAAATAEIDVSQADLDAAFLRVTFHPSPSLDLSSFGESTVLSVSAIGTVEAENDPTFEVRAWQTEGPDTAHMRIIAHDPSALVSLMEWRSFARGEAVSENGGWAVVAGTAVTGGRQYAVSAPIGSKRGVEIEYRATLSDGRIMRDGRSYDADTTPSVEASLRRRAHEQGGGLFADLAADEDVTHVAYKVTSDGTEPVITGTAGVDFSVVEVAGGARTSILLAGEPLAFGTLYRAVLRPYGHAPGTAASGWAAGDGRQGTDVPLSLAMEEEQVEVVSYDLQRRGSGHAVSGASELAYDAMLHIGAHGRTPYWRDGSVTVKARSRKVDGSGIAEQDIAFAGADEFGAPSESGPFQYHFDLVRDGAQGGPPSDTGGGATLFLPRNAFAVTKGLTGYRTYTDAAVTPHLAPHHELVVTFHAGRGGTGAVVGRAVLSTGEQRVRIGGGADFEQGYDPSEVAAELDAYKTQAAGTFATKAELSQQVGAAEGRSVPLSRKLTLAGANDLSVSPSGAQDLSSDRSFTISLPQALGKTRTPEFAGLKIGADGLVKGEGAGTLGFYASDGTNYGSIVVRDLYITGEINSKDTNILRVEDSFIHVNKGQAGLPTLNGGLVVERGSQPNAALEWDEGLDAWGVKIGTAAFQPLALRDGTLQTNLNAERLGGQHGDFYRNASNINVGTLGRSRLSGTYDISVTGTSVGVVRLDTRDVDDAPYVVKERLALEFKRKNVIGLSDGVSNPYAGLLTVAAWGDTSGGNSHQLAFSGEGVFHRAGSTVWGAWGKLADLSKNEHVTGAWRFKESTTHEKQITFARALSSNNRLIDFQQGYELFSENVGAGADNTRLWIGTPDAGEVVIGPRAGASVLAQMRLRSRLFRVSRNDGTLDESTLYFDSSGAVVNGYRVWDSGNDGAGSGLDADLLRGVAGNLYTRRDVQELVQQSWTWGANAHIYLNGGSFYLRAPDTGGGWARGITFQNKEASATWGGIGMLGSADSATNIYLAHGAAPWGSALGIHIKTDGNVGIGMTNPQYRLHNVGTFHNAGAATLGSTLAVTGKTTLSGGLEVFSSAMIADTLQINNDNSKTSVIALRSGTPDPDHSLFAGVLYNNNTGRTTLRGSAFVHNEYGNTWQVIKRTWNEASSKYDEAFALRLDANRKFTIYGDTITGGSIGTSAFTSGFAGSGWRIENANAEFQNLTVRGSMRLYELEVSKIRSGNGSYWFASGAKAVKVADRGTVTFSTSGNTWSIYEGTVKPRWRLYFDAEVGGVPFASGDVVRAQTWSGRDVRLTVGVVVDSGTFNTGSDAGRHYADIALVEGVSPAADQEFVRIGNTGLTSDRKGAVYITSEDSGAPFIDVIDGVRSHEDFAGSAKTKARLGKLDGITAFGSALSGYGLYAQRAVLTDDVVIGKGAEKITVTSSGIAFEGVGEKLISALGTLKLKATNINLDSVVTAINASALTLSVDRFEANALVTRINSATTTLDSNRLNINTLIGRINASSFTIDADNVNINGIVSMMNAGTTTKISGGAIETGTITADKIAFRTGGGNLCRNSSFEQDMSGWTIINTGGGASSHTAQTVGAASQHGEKMLLLSATLPQAARYGVYQMTDAADGVRPNETYTLSAYIKPISVTGNVIVRLYLDFCNEAGTVVSGQTVSNTHAIAGGQSLRRIELTYTPTGTNVRRVRFYVWLEGGSGGGSATCYVDAVQLERGGVASGFSVRQEELPAGSITGTMITNGAITTPHITVNTLDGDRIKANTLHANRITARTITADRIAAGTITANEINVSNLVASSAFINALKTQTLDVTGKITANEGTFGSKTFIGKNLQATSYQKGQALFIGGWNADGSRPTIRLQHHEDNGQFVELYGDGAAYGIRAMDYTDTLFSLGSNNQIAGFQFSAAGLSRDGLLLSSSGAVRGLSLSTQGRVALRVGDFTPAAPVASESTVALSNTGSKHPNYLGASYVATGGNYSMGAGEIQSVLVHGREVGEFNVSPTPSVVGKWVRIVVSARANNDPSLNQNALGLSVNVDAGKPHLNAQYLDNASGATKTFDHDTGWYVADAQPAVRAAGISRGFGYYDDMSLTVAVYVREDDPVFEAWAGGFRAYSAGGMHMLDFDGKSLSYKGDTMRVEAMMDADHVRARGGVRMGALGSEAHLYAEGSDLYVHFGGNRYRLQKVAA